ncbi:MAG: hypothetical protein DLM72_01975 [Candidatus Nitrosopolaris wilkensis]|nr:MAG: hypothetical protein DLM72_01975 [Candidatus Nitrosopolaris wilkensis]
MEENHINHSLTMALETRPPKRIRRPKTCLASVFKSRLTKDDRVEMMSETYQHVQLRRVNAHGKNNYSLVVTIPHQFLKDTEIKKGDYVSMILEKNEILLQKVETNNKK